MVLQGLNGPSFESLLGESLKHVSLKIVLLLVLTPAKQDSVLSSLWEIRI